MVHQIESNIPSMIKSNQLKKLFRNQAIEKCYQHCYYDNDSIGHINCLLKHQVILMLCLLRLRPHSHWMRLVNALFLQLFCTLWQQTPPRNELKQIFFLPLHSLFWCNPCENLSQHIVQWNWATWNCASQFMSPPCQFYNIGFIHFKPSLYNYHTEVI